MKNRTSLVRGERFNWRLKNIVDAMNFTEPEKVPVGFDCISWPYRCAGKTLEELVDNPEVHAAAYCSYMDQIEFDFSMFAGGYEPYDTFEALGSSAFGLCEDRCTVQHNQAKHKFMDEEDYDVLIKDFNYFRDEYYPKKVVSALHGPRDQAYATLKQAAQRAARCARTSDLILRKTVEEYQVVPLARQGRPEGAMNYYSAIDSLFDNYRGMMGVFEDLVEEPERLQAACQSIFDADYSVPLDDLPDSFEESCWPFGFAVYHCAPFLSPEHFDTYWFQGFKKVLLPYAERGMKIYLKGESSFLHTIERFKEFPRGSVLIQLDLDEPEAAYKKIGGWQPLCTGIRTSMLMRADRTECFDHIKRMFDTFAPGGGFLFYQDMPLLSPGDAAPHFVQEVWQFANEYARKR